jgi:hypothetical protein
MALSSTSSYGTTPKMTLAAAVAPAGTLTVPYPTGTAQADYTSANAGSTTDNMAVVSGIKYTGGTLLGFAYGASNITVTNSTPDTWALAADAYFSFPKLDPVQRYNGPKAVL